MTTLELHQLNRSQLASLDNALKYAEQSAEFLSISLGELLPLMMDRKTTRRPGGARKGAGRPSRIWSNLAGNNLLTLPLRLEVEKAAHRTHSDEPLSDLDAFQRTLAAGTSRAKARELHKEFRRTSKQPPKDEVERHRASRERRRRDRQMGENQT